jgi:hypothetical protein
MPQDFNVTKAFLSTNQETGQPEVINTQGGPMNKFMFQLAEHPGVWFNTLKKQGNELKPGETVYGTVAMNNWNKLAFTRASRPQGQYPAPQQGVAAQPQQTAYQQPAPAAAPQSGVTLQMVYDELKLVRGLLENQFQPTQVGTYQAPGGDTVITDIEHGPADLSKLDY